MKFLTLMVVAAWTSFAAMAHAATLSGDPGNDGARTHVAGPRDPYTDGARASKFDVYSEGTKITDRRDPYTDGAHG